MKDRVIRFLLYTIFGGIVALIAIIITFSYVKTPAHQNLEKENTALKHQFLLTEKRLSNYLEILNYLALSLLY